MAVVTASWLVESMRAQALKAIQDYTVVESFKIFPHQQVDNNNIISTGELPEKKGFVKMSLAPKRAPLKTTQTLPKVPFVTAKPSEPKQQQQQQLSQDFKDLMLLEECDKVKSTKQARGSLPFSGLTFCLRFPGLADHAQRVKGRIESNGGVVIDRGLNLEPSVYIVVPFMYYQ